MHIDPPFIISISPETCLIRIPMMQVEVSLQICTVLSMIDDHCSDSKVTLSISETSSFSLFSVAEQDGRSPILSEHRKSVFPHDAAQLGHTSVSIIIKGNSPSDAGY